MKNIFVTTLSLGVIASISFTAQSQAEAQKPGNCAIYAQMSADAVKKDSRFDGHDDIVLGLESFAKAQSDKMAASMEETYAASKAFGWDKAKVDEMIAQSEGGVRAGFFTSTMDKSKLYMDHVMHVYACAQAHPNDLGQSQEALTTVLKKMAEIVRG